MSNGPLVEVRMEGERAFASASFFRPLEKLEIVRNGEVIGVVAGDGEFTWLALSTAVDMRESCRVAARWKAELEWYRNAGLVFGGKEREQFLADGERALGNCSGRLSTEAQFGRG